MEKLQEDEVAEDRKHSTTCSNERRNPRFKRTKSGRQKTTKWADERIIKIQNGISECITEHAGKYQYKPLKLTENISGNDGLFNKQLENLKDLDKAFQKNHREGSSEKRTSGIYRPAKY